MKGGKKKRRLGLLGKFMAFMRVDEEDDYEDYEDDPELEEDVGPRLYTGGKKSNPNLRLVKGTAQGEGSGKRKAGERLRLTDDLEPDDDAMEDILADEEDDGQERPWVTVMTFLGLAVLAAVICAILWHFTHKSDGDGQNLPSDASASFEAGNGEQTGNGENPDSGQAPEDEAGNGDSETSGVQDMEPDDDSQPAEESRDHQTDQVPGEQEEPSEWDNPESETDSDGPVQEQEDGTTAMNFTEQQESVTPKDVVNLRSVPTTADDGNIVVQCKNGEVLTRTGINKDTGWSQLDYNGQTVYAVTQYLTSNLDYKPPVQAANPNRVSTAGGRVIIFSDCDDWISPKEYVNLRLEPSTDGGNDTVSCQLNYGEKAHRTGYSTDSGWSRVEYDGKVLYVVTSLMYVVEPD